MVKTWFGLDKRTNSSRKVFFCNFWDSSCLTFSQDDSCHSVDQCNEQTNKPMPHPHCCPDSVVKLPLKIDGPPHWTTVGFPLSRCPGVGLLFWKGETRNVPKAFGRTISNKNCPNKSWAMKRLLQLQLSNFAIDLNLNLAFFKSEHLKNFTNNFASFR